MTSAARGQDRPSSSSSTSWTWSGPVGCWCCCCCYRCCCSSRCSVGKATRNPLCFDYIPDFELGRLKATWLQVVMDDMASTPDCDHRGGVRVDSAVTRTDDASVRSHPQLFNGRLRSTTASSGTTASSKMAPPEVVVTAYPAWPACCCFSVVSIKRTRRGHPCDQNHKLFPWAAHEHWTQLHCVALFTACLTFMFHKPPLG